MAKITITGLKRAEDDLFKRVDRPGTHTYETSIPPAWLKLDISQIASELGKLGYLTPSRLETNTDTVRVKVVDKTAESCYDAAGGKDLRIRENESFASWWTKLNGGHKNDEVTHTDTSVSVYGTTTTFERTLRVPDSDKSHRLPPSMGKFPVVPVKDHADKVPAMVAARGGYMMPMYQREALWSNFSHQANVSNAMKVSVGGINALTGKKKGQRSKAGVQDYICKSQPWLDGIVKEEGKVKQFVAMPVGKGYTIEEQLTGKPSSKVCIINGAIDDTDFNTEATLQLDIFPSFRRDAEVKFKGQAIKDLLKSPSQAGASLGDFVELRPRTFTGGYNLESMVSLHGEVKLKAVYEELNRWAASGSLYGAGPVMSKGMSVGMSMVDQIATRGYSMPPGMAAKPNVSIGIAAGGSITQQINKDAHSPDIYDFNAGKRIYIHFINAGAWKHVTGRAAPLTPVDKKAYKDHNIPWFDLYNEPEPAKGLGAGFKDVKSIKDIDDKAKKASKASKGNDSKSVCAHCGDTKVTGDEKLFGQRWENNKEGKIVDIDASGSTMMKFSTKLPFVSVVKPATRGGTCNCQKGVVGNDHQDGAAEWTYESDNVSSLSQ